MSENIEAKNRLSESHPYLYSFLIVAFSMLVSVVLSNLLQSIFGIIFTALDGEASPTAVSEMSNTASAVISLASYIIVLLIYLVVYRKSISFSSFFSSHGTGRGIILGWSVLLISVFTLICNLISHMAFGSVWKALLLGMTPGITEEIFCRIIPLSIVMKSPNRKKLMLPSVLFSGLIFGLSHMINFFSGADFVTTLFQVLYAAGTGLLFGLIYITTGNLWITVILHSITDVVFFLGADVQLTGGVLSQNTAFSDGIFYLIYAVLYIVNAYFVFRKKRGSDSSVVWAGIWQKEQKS